VARHRSLGATHAHPGEQTPLPLSTKAILSRRLTVYENTELHIFTRVTDRWCSRCLLGAFFSDICSRGGCVGHHLLDTALRFLDTQVRLVVIACFLAGLYCRDARFSELDFPRRSDWQRRRLVAWFIIHWHRRCHCVRFSIFISGRQSQTFDMTPPNTALEPTRLAHSVMRFGFPPFGSRRPRGSSFGR
jgi:hypothetical protein